MEIWPALIAAVAGTAGIAGLFSGLAQITRSNRLRNRLEKNNALLEMLSPSSREATGVRLAIRYDAARIVSLSTVELKTSDRISVTLIVVSAFLAPTVPIVFGPLPRQLPTIGSFLELMTTNVVTPEFAWTIPVFGALGCALWIMAYYLLNKELWEPRRKVVRGIVDDVSS